MRERWKPASGTTPRPERLSHRSVPLEPDAGPLEPNPGGNAGPRPAAGLALALGLGAWLGSLLVGKPMLPGGLLLALCPAVFITPRRPRPRDVGLGLIALLSFFHMRVSISAALPLSGGATPTDTAVLPPDSPLEQRVLVGEWRALGGQTSGGQARGRLLGQDDDGVLMALDGAPPRDGQWVVILPGDPATRLPAGPIEGARARAGFVARRRVRADAWYVLDEMADGKMPEDATHSASKRALNWNSGGWISGPGGFHPQAAGMGHRVASLVEAMRDRIRERLVRLDSVAAGARSQGTLDPGTLAYKVPYTRSAGVGGYGHGRADPKGLVQALVLGETTAVSRAFEDLTRRTGVRHLLAVSGMHVGLVCLLLVAPLGRRFGRGVALLALLLFVLIAGARSPVLRAALAAALVLLAPRSGRPPRSSPVESMTSARRIDGATLWSLALALELLWCPAGLGDVGLQLSYLATAGILIGTRPLTIGLRRCAQALAPRSRRKRLRPGILSLLGGRLGEGLIAILGTSCAALLVTVPVTWMIFGEMAPVGIVLTPLALPLIAVALVLALAYASMAPVLPLGLIGPALGWVEGLLEGLLRTADQLGGTPMSLPTRPAWLLALMGVLLLFQLRRAAPGKLRSLTYLVAGVLLVPWSPTPARFELHVLDSGHGTCAIARGPGLAALVFDAGSRDRTGLYSEAIAPLLASWDVTRPVVVLSHDHSDHQSALAELVSRRAPALWGGTVPRGLTLPRGVPLVSVATGSARMPLRRGGPIEAVLHRGLEGSGNEGSVALELRLLPTPPGDRTSWGAVQGKRSPASRQTRITVRRPAQLLLMGDAEGEGLGNMLAMGHLPRRIDLLLAPHHGSDTDLLDSLLAWTQPRDIWVTSAGRPAIAEELDRRNLPWRVPALDGPLSFLWP